VKRRSIISNPVLLGNLRSSSKKTIPRQKSPIEKNSKLSIISFDVITVSPSTKDDVMKSLNYYLKEMENEIMDADRYKRSLKQQLESFAAENETLRTLAHEANLKLETFSKNFQRDKQIVKTCLVNNNLTLYDLNMYVNNLEEYFKLRSTNTPPVRASQSFDISGLINKNESMSFSLARILDENERLIREIEKGNALASMYVNNGEEDYSSLNSRSFEREFRTEIEKYRANEDISIKIIERLKRRLKEAEAHIEIFKGNHDKKGLKNTIEKLIANEKKIESLESQLSDCQNKVLNYEKRNADLQVEKIIIMKINIEKLYLGVFKCLCA
jgi:hypothetical protein